MKTQNEILIDFYIVAKNALSGNIGGNVYKKTRPTDNVSEDCVLHLFTGVSGKFVQDGSISIKIYYQDIKNGDNYYEDMERGQELEQLLWGLFDSLIDLPDYAIYKNTREFNVDAIPEVNQHLVTMNFNFKI